MRNEMEKKVPAIAGEQATRMSEYCFEGCGCLEEGAISTADKSVADRVNRVRRMVEGADDPDLFSPHFVNRAPWDIATQQHSSDQTAAFRADKVFSDLNITVDEGFAAGDTVVVRWTLRGNWSGPLPFAPTIPPTGNRVEFPGTYIFRFEGDKIVEKTGEFDIKVASKALLGGLNITCGSEECIDVVQVLSSRPDNGGTRS
jgi:predicted ester cyclase